MPTLGRRRSFWTLAVVLGLYFAAASAPSPLYVVYQARWQFSPTMLTVIFAVYVFALLAALLTMGSVSDRAGRRPVLAVALVVEALSMVVFALATGVGWLIAARVLQGLATGIATGTISAAILDLRPPSEGQSGALANSSSPAFGLAVGALASGLLVEHAPDPSRLIYWLLLALFVLALVATYALPETVADRGRLRAGMLRPRIGVPREVRSTFIAVSPGLVATWALSGLYLSLGPSLAVSLLHTSSHLVGGLVIVGLAATGGVAILLLRAVPPAAAMTGGALVLVVGVAITVVALHAGSLIWVLVGSVVAGCGFGPAFAGALRTLVGGAPADGRAALLAAIYIVSYLAFSLPAIAAGIASSHYGLRATTDAYAGVVIVLALTATAATLFQRRRSRTLEPAT